MVSKYFWVGHNWIVGNTLFIVANEFEKYAAMTPELPWYITPGLCFFGAAFYYFLTIQVGTARGQ